MRLVQKDSLHNPDDSVCPKNEIGMVKSRSYTGRLDQRKALLAKRWDRIVDRVEVINWGNISIRALASRSGLEWYRTRGDELLANFLGFDGVTLLARHGLGFRKIERLCEIVERALDMVLDEDFADPVSTAASNDPHETLVAWGVPPGFPCRLARLPVRLVNFCDKQGLAGIGELLSAWEKLGFEGFKAQRNLGSLSVRRMQVFVESLRKRDFENVSSFLPLDLAGSGVSLGRALVLIALEPSVLDKSLLNRRLVLGMTLEVSAEESGLTRERVRQVEANFLSEVSEVLKYFREDFARLLHAWIGVSDWSQQLKSLGLQEDEVFITAALEAVFKETPQAVARALGEESSLENWHEELVSHPELWFGGVKLSEFLSDQISTAHHQVFCAYVSESSVLRLDHSDGRVYPARTSLRHAVESLLAREDDPIALTWLVEMLKRTGYHPALSPRDLTRQRRPWVRDYGFPAEKILWSQ